MVGQVRCTGERAGCSRCRKLNIYCTYPVSMVGRMSRGKRKRPQNDQTYHACRGDHDLQRTPHDSAAGCSPQPLESTSCPDAARSIQYLSPVDIFLRDQSVSDGNDDLSHIHRQHGNTLSVPGPFHGDCLATSTSFDANRPISTSFFSPPPEDEILPPTPEYATLSPFTSVKSSQASTFAKGRFECISILSQILQSLETQAQMKPQLIDRILQTTKHATLNLAKIITTDEYQACRCCDMIILSALDLILSLFGQSVKMLDDKSQRELPQLQFGTYTAEAGEQIELLRVIILREVKGFSRVLTSFGDAWRNKADTEHADLAEQLCSRLEARIECIKSQLEC